MRTKIILIFIAAMVIILGSTFYFVKGGISLFSRGETQSLYAVHLSDGQVYFGSITSISGDTITLKDAYYIETYTAGNTVTSKGKEFAVQQAPKQIYSLMRRGDNKSLATDHTLYLNRGAILFWERLSPDSDIVSSINAAMGQNKEGKK